MKFSRWPSKLAATALVTGVLVASHSGSADASYSDGVAQPGDLATNSSGSYICSAGPVVGDVIFTAQHCTGVSTVDGVRLYASSELEPYDTRWSKVDGAISNAISTGGGDLPVAGVLQPWPGMKVWKSGRTTGVTGPGTVDGFITDDSYSVNISGIPVCRGDSGGVAYTTIGGKNYLIGMVLRGNGSEYKDGSRAPNGQCADPTKGEPQAPPYYGGIQDITTMCRVAGLSDCVNEAGRPVGAITAVAGAPGTIKVDGWGFDPSEAARAIKASVLIDGKPTRDVTTGIDRPAVRQEWSLLPSSKPGFSGTIPASPGRHEVCVRLKNIGSGVDADLGCRTVNVAPGDPAATGVEDLVQLDFNGDGKTDIFSLGRRDAQGLFPWRVSFGGTSRWKTVNRASESLANLRFGDFNGDGKTDVFSLGKRDGQGLSPWRVSFGGTSRWKTVNRAKESLANLRFGDFNGDGKADVFSLGKRDAQGLSPWRVSYGATARWKTVNSAGVKLSNMRFGDFNGDGKADVFSLGKRDAQGLSPWRVSFGATARWKTVNRATESLAKLRFGDFNGDGKIDVFSLGKRDAQGLSPWRVSFGATARWKTVNRAEVSLTNLRFGDFNGDGKIDVFSFGKRQSDGLYPWRVSHGGTSRWKTINSAGAHLYDLRLR